MAVLSVMGGSGDKSSDVSFTEKEGKGEKTTAVKFDKADIYEGKKVKISITGFSESSRDVDIEFTVENNSKKDYGIAAHSYAINGLMVGGTEYMTDVDVPAGKKGSFEISVDKEWLAENGIDHIGKLDVLFWAYHDDFKDWDTGVIEVKTNLYDKEKMYKPDGEKVYNDDNMALWLVEHEDNEYKFVVKNKTSYDVNYNMKNCSIDDWTYEDENFFLDLYNESIHGKSYFEYEFEVDDDFMEENKIENIGSLEFNMEMEDEYIDDFTDIWEAKSGKITIK